jgi:hypothetical protein
VIILLGSFGNRYSLIVCVTLPETSSSVRIMQGPGRWVPRNVEAKGHVADDEGEGEDPARTLVVAWEGDVREDGSADCHEFDGVVSLRQETRAVPEITLGVGADDAIAVEMRYL